jgi:hypothetical protein
MILWASVGVVESTRAHNFCRNAKEMVSELLDPLESRGIGYLPI